MKKAIHVQIPSIPNFIRVGQESLPISYFSEKELKAIGRAWTKKLLLVAATKKAECPACTKGEYPHRNCVMR